MSKFPLRSRSVRFLKLEICGISETPLLENLKLMKNWGFLTSERLLMLEAPRPVFEELEVPCRTFLGIPEPELQELLQAT